MVKLGGKSRVHRGFIFPFIMGQTCTCLDDEGESHCQSRGGGPEEGTWNQRPEEWEGGPSCVLLRTRSRTESQL